MSKSSSARKRQFWRSGGFVGACSVLASIVLWGSDTVDLPGRRSHDVTAAQSPLQSSDRDALATVAVVDRSCRHGGETALSASSYDSAAKAAASDDPFAKTAVFDRPRGPVHPPGGGGQSDFEA